MSPRQLLERLISITPAFARHWESDANLSLDRNGGYSLHGVCCEYTDFFRDNYLDLGEEPTRRLFEMIELYVDETGASETDIDNALCTCFLENIASEDCGSHARDFMGTKSRRFFDQWHTAPNG